MATEGCWGVRSLGDRSFVMPASGDLLAGLCWDLGMRAIEFRVRISVGSPDLICWFLSGLAESTTLLVLPGKTLVELQYQEQNVKILSEARAKGIISPELTPQLSDILKKDSVRSFLNLFENNLSRLTWGYIIAAHTFNFIVALEGKARKLFGNQVNPNYMTSFGFFPLHQAAATFSLDMINLLIDYGASANVRTAGSEIIEGLLPLHVAIENACMHKYLEDNLLIDQKHLEHSDLHVDYIYKLIHLLCLPEMKMFLDTIRLLAKNTDNVIDELWNYIKVGRLAHTAILLLAADQQLRNGYKSEGNGDKSTLQVPHHDILQHVSSVLKDHGFIPAGKCIDIADLYWLAYEVASSLAPLKPTAVSCEIWHRWSCLSAQC
ncbi:hypothetical protein PR202_ga05415 [Eleusine coracana subsp. coracana]|uniref:Uncharacterized protein n=1 Tax=Eleusine coracana subsp. coracana TaxID=191504 RepID=A0AAV5BR86_ELECO|nr:hypothetical protein PR202_ga04962 [Eleusine coracana subsp. coracana]GJM89246.1 hypothetical protein PR202_ga05415 [Eleusine coracana subsp. coracana]